MTRLSHTRATALDPWANTAFTVLHSGAIKVQVTPEPRDDGALMIDMLRGYCSIESQGDDAADAQPDVAVEHWDILFNAVKDRLRLSVGERLAGASESPVPAAAGARDSILECVQALDQLHTMLEQERGQRRQLERRSFDAQTATQAALATVPGTMDGPRRAPHLALHDRLTSLPNRALFRTRLELALAEAQPLRRELAVLYLDLDGFQPINDAHGREAGDEILRIVAARLTRAVRAEDVVSRLGGDEFACVLAGVPSREQLGQRAWRVFDAVSAPFRIGDLKLSVRPSIGIAVCPVDGATADALLRSADTALYRAKRQQSGFAFVDDAFEARASEPEGYQDFRDSPNPPPRRTERAPRAHAG